MSLSSSSSAATAVTHVVELTPPGRAAVSVVLVAGPEAEVLAGQCFHAVSGRPLGDTPLGRIALGRWCGPDGEELVACRRSAGQIEIHCHGGAAAVNAVIGQLCERGCQRMSWQDWLRRSSPDPIHVAAQIALSEAPTARTAAILLDQYHGALTRAIQQVAALVAAANWPQAAAVIDAILSHGDVGLHLTTPWRVVLAGPTNVGKSSLINALAGFQRAIVSPQPGTTRDVVTTLTAIDGWPVELSDTAGLRDTSDELESAGIALAEAKMAAADMVCFVQDATQFPHRETAGFYPLDGILATPPPTVRVLHVINKVDLITADLAETEMNGQLELQSIRTSALTGEGIAKLVAEIGRLLVPNPPPDGAAVPFTSEQLAALSAARRSVDERDSASAMAALQPLLAH